MLKGKTPLLVAIVLGVLAGIIAYSAIKQKENEVRRGWDLVPVIVAATDIAAGTEIALEMVAQRPIPSQFVSASNIKFDEHVLNTLVGQKVMVEIKAGDPLLWTQFETTKGFEKLSTVVQKKGRAVTITVGETGAVGGWVRPNDLVDVLGTFRDPQSNEMVTVTLLQNVIVLATGKITGTTNVQYVEEGKKNYSNVSLQLLPEEAEIVTLASQLGQLTLALRNPEDIDTSEERGRATIQTLLTGERVKALQRIRMNTLQVQVIHGRSSRNEGDSNVISGRSGGN
jgi:pilus assembly protein CpaB